MTDQQMKELSTGDIVRSKASGTAYVVTANYGNHATAAKTVEVTNAQEWELAFKAYQSPVISEP